MSTFTVPIQVSWTEDGPQERLEAWVDTGAHYSWIPRDVLDRLGVRPHTVREVTLASGDKENREICRVWLTYEDQTEHTIAVVGPERGNTLLGAYSLEGWALAVDPVNERLIPVEMIPAFRTETRNLRPNT